MEKLRLVISARGIKNFLEVDWLEDDCIDYNSLKECLETRKFSALKIEDVGLHYCPEAYCMEELIRYLSQWFESLQCGSIVDLVVKDSDPELSSKIFKRCNNLKRLEYVFVPEDFAEPEPLTCWPEFTFQLEKLEVRVYDPEESFFTEHFEQFLSNQKNLNEILISNGNFSWRKINTYMKVEVDPFLKLEWNTPTVEYSAKPLNLLYLRYSNDDLDGHPADSYEVPPDINEFENKFRAFMDNESTQWNSTGMKLSRLIFKVSIGWQKWVDEDVALSKQFIEDLIAKMPNLRVLELFTVLNLEEIQEVITASEKKFDEIAIHTKDGIVNIPS
jgi:hypothetical protein